MRKKAIALQRKSLQFRRDENAIRSRRILQARRNIIYRRQRNKKERILYQAQKEVLSPLKTTRQRLRRLDILLRTPERIRDAKKRSLRRFDPVRRRLDLAANSKCKTKLKDSQSGYESHLQKFIKKCKQGPVFICSCCGAILYEESTVKITESKLHACDSETIENILHVEQSCHRLCKTCFSYARRGAIPRTCLANGLDFPVIPNEIQVLQT